MLYKLCFYVPKEMKESVKKAIFKAGAGQIGHYSQCSFDLEGVGQFRPNDKANPAIGQVNQLTTVNEVKVETFCKSTHIKAILNALIKAHPYEEPSYHVMPVMTIQDFF